MIDSSCELKRTFSKRVDCLRSARFNDKRCINDTRRTKLQRQNVFRFALFFLKDFFFERQEERRSWWQRKDQMMDDMDLNFIFWYSFSLFVIESSFSRRLLLSTLSSLSKPAFPVNSILFFQLLFSSSFFIETLLWDREWHETQVSNWSCWCREKRNRKTRFATKLRNRREKT